MTYPAIPEGCERFRRDEIGRWEFQFPGVDNDAGWEMVDAIYCLAGITPESRLLWRDLCNAARCAWLDEAERIWLAQPRPVIAMYRYWDGLTYWESGILDPVRLQYLEWPAWEIDHAHCLAHAEAWAREAKE